MNQEKIAQAIRLADAACSFMCTTEDQAKAVAALADEAIRLHDNIVEMQDLNINRLAKMDSLSKELTAEAARTAEWKLRADQMTEQHLMQGNLLKEAQSQRQMLADALGECLVASGIVAFNAGGFSGPQLLMFAEDLKGQLSAIGAGGVEALRKPLQAVEFPDSVIAGALFDFCGYLTTMPKDQAITVSGSHEASSIVEALKAWAANRSLHLDDADVSGWRVAPAQEHATEGEATAAQLEAAWRDGWAKCRDAEYVGQEAEDWAFGQSQTNSIAIDATQLAGQGVEGETVAYLDLGAGGYLDIGTDLSDEQLSKLPKGRHMLVIGGTYGVDGYAAAPGEMQKESDAAQLLKKYRKLCLEIGRGDSYHIARIDAAISAASAPAHKDEQA